MNIESILKRHIDEYSQHDGSMDSYKHMDAEFKEVLIDAIKESINEFVKEFEGECVNCLVIHGWDYNKNEEECREMWNKSQWHSIIENQIKILNQ